MHRKAISEVAIASATAGTVLFSLLVLIKIAPGRIHIAEIILLYFPVSAWFFLSAVFAYLGLLLVDRFRSQFGSSWIICCFLILLGAGLPGLFHELIWLGEDLLIFLAAGAFTGMAAFIIYIRKRNTD